MPSVILELLLNPLPGRRIMVLSFPPPTPIQPIFHKLAEGPNASHRAPVGTAHTPGSKSRSLQPGCPPSCAGGCHGKCEQPRRSRCFEPSPDAQRPAEVDVAAPPSPCSRASRL